MRPEPAASPAPLRRRATEEDVRTYRFLTYVMGGGVQVREHEKLADDVTPVRAASIRGQLRFWWRACNPSGCTTLDELRQREGEIWGATSQPSQVIVEVLEQPAPPVSVQVYEYNQNGRTQPIRGLWELAYGAFPLQPSRQAQLARRNPGVLHDYRSSFRIRFSYPQSLEKDVTAALWAWETFGGLGARTRRGFGAVSRVGGEAPSLERIERELQGFRAVPRIAGVPSVAGARFGLAKTASRDAVHAWTQLLRALQRLRQGVGLGRNESQNNRPAGRSRWPEPDQIRRITRMAAERHSRPTVNVERFPRASFGLPIVFHFEARNQGDPNFDVLQIHPVGYDRFPSSLILRPIPDGRSFWPAALVLSAETPDIALTYDDKTEAVQWNLDAALASQIRPLNDSTPQGMKTFTDPIDRFLWELKK